MPEIVTTVCWPCVVGLHEECFDPDLVQPEEIEDALGNDDNWIQCCCHRHKDDDAAAFAKGVGRPVLDPKDITDITSTGRKRAAMLYPILEGMLCEWAGLKNAGGGVKPIIGCEGNRIYSGKGSDKGDRHHGPNKNVIDNEPGNVHRICSPCHNRWHALNNEFYLGERPPADQPWMPTAPEGMTVYRHDPDTLATEEEIEANEQWWATRKIDRVDIED